jgi:hypothetical protein
LSNDIITFAFDSSQYLLTYEASKITSRSVGTQAGSLQQGPSIRASGNRMDQNHSEITGHVAGATRTQNEITLSALTEVAKALDMELVYGFVPKGGSVMHLVEEKAKKMATEIVMRTSQNMRLEDQSLPHKRIEKAIADRTQEILKELPKSLWD